MLLTYFSTNLSAQTFISSSHGNGHSGVGGCGDCIDRDLESECLIPQNGIISIPFYIIFNTKNDIPDNIIFSVYDNDTKLKVGETLLAQNELEIIEGAVEECNYYKQEFDVEIEIYSDCIGDLNDNYSFSSEIFNFYGDFTINGVKITESNPELFDPNCYKDINGNVISHIHSETDIFKIPICCELLDNDDEKIDDNSYKNNKNILDNMNIIGEENKIKNNKLTLPSSYQPKEEKIYPNPTFNYLTISEEIQHNFDVYMIINSQGKYLSVNYITPEIETTNLVTGFYLIKFKNEESGLSTLSKFYKK